MEIIIKKSGTEASRKKREAAAQILKHYYAREQRDGAAFKTKGGFSKNAIKKVYEGDGS